MNDDEDDELDEPGWLPNDADEECGSNKDIRIFREYINQGS
jgi:hypothetical protein